MKVTLSNPRRQLEVAGPKQVDALLSELGVLRETVLVIRDGTLVLGNAVLADGDDVEVRPVISGGSA